MSDEGPLEPTPTSKYSPIWKDELPTSAQTPNPAAGSFTPTAGEAYGSLLASSAVALPAPVPISEERGLGSLPVALLAGAVVALVGGLAWAGVVIGTNYDIGILAWLIGAATGFAIAAVAGGPVDTGSRVAAGSFAAAGIMVGKYVIFVHQLREALSNFASLTTGGVSIGYFDGRVRHLFFSDFSSIVKPIYILWVGLAFFAAYRVAGGGQIFRRRFF
jgi:hypothetical protein